MISRSAALPGVRDTDVYLIEDVISISVFLYDRSRVGDIVAISVVAETQTRPAILENVI